MNTKSAIENIEAIRTYLTAGNPMWSVEVVKEACDKAIEALKQSQWIPTSERLPEDLRDVLVWFEYFRYGDYNCMYSTYGIGNYSNRYDSWLINHETGWTDLHVFAWMPMPEPPKMGGKQE